jgi:acetolactate synthase-1/2/3 large subunit
MVLFVGDVASDQRDREAFQEVEYTSFFGPSTKGMAKRVERIDEPDRIPEYVRARVRHAHERPARAGGAGAARGHADALDQRPAAAEGGAGAGLERPGSLRELREMLLQSRKPFVIAGGGGWTPQAAQALQRFAENWKLPVGNAFRFQDTFDNTIRSMRRRGHRPEPQAGGAHQGQRPDPRHRPAPGRDDHGGYTLLQAPSPSRSWCISTRAPKSSTGFTRPTWRSTRR